MASALECASHSPQLTDLHLGDPRCADRTAHHRRGRRADRPYRTVRARLARSGIDSRNFVLCPGNAYDRSPCGTGTSAKVACLAADGKLGAKARCGGRKASSAACSRRRYRARATTLHAGIWCRPSPATRTSWRKGRCVSTSAIRLHGACARHDGGAHPDVIWSARGLSARRARRNWPRAACRSRCSIGTASAAARRLRAWAIIVVMNDSPAEFALSAYSRELWLELAPQLRKRDAFVALRHAVGRRRRRRSGKPRARCTRARAAAQGIAAQLLDSAALRAGEPALASWHGGRPAIERRQHRVRADGRRMVAHAVA